MRSIYILLLALALSPLAAAQSIDCLHAKSPREHAVCSNQDLRTLDNNVAEAYKAAHNKLSGAAFKLVQSDQRVWLRWLDMVCPPSDFIVNCLTWHYNGRLQQLTRGIVTVNGMTFYPRAQYSFARDPTRDPDDFDPARPGFSSDEDVWPQIDIKRDKPTRAYAEWNEHFHQPQPPPKHTKSSADDSTVRSEDTFDVIAANDRLIDVSFTSILDLGGAHPLVNVSTDLWWLDKHRKLIASDVFRPDSNWQQKLIDPTIRKLQAGYRDEGVNADRQAVATVIPRVSTWSLTSKGLTITFQQYEVGPHSLNMPDITFTWDELKPYLEPSLNPSTLPAPVPNPTPESTDR